MRQSLFLKNNFPRGSCCIVPMGFDCEISFKLRAYQERMESFPLSYTLVVDRSSLIGFVQNPSNLITGSIFEFIYPLQVASFSALNIGLHYRSNPNDGTAIGDNEKRQELCSRMTHLIEKYKIAMKEPVPLIFLLKVRSTNFGDDRDFILSLFQSLQAQRNFSFLLVPIFESSQTNKRFYKSLKSLGSQGILPLFVRNFWPNGLKYRWETKGDFWGWLRILRKFSKGSFWKYYWTRFNPKPFLKRVGHFLLRPFRRLSK